MAGGRGAACDSLGEVVAALGEDSGGSDDLGTGGAAALAGAALDVVFDGSVAGSERGLGESNPLRERMVRDLVANPGVVGVLAGALGTGQVVVASPNAGEGLAAAERIEGMDARPVAGALDEVVTGGLVEEIPDSSFGRGFVEDGDVLVWPAPHTSVAAAEATDVPRDSAIEVTLEANEMIDVRDGRE